MVYGSGTNTIANISTDNNNIDSLIASRRWRSRAVTFSFTDDFWQDYEDELGYPNSSIHASSFSSFDALQRSIVRDWMEMYANVSGLTFTELVGVGDRDATIRIAESDAPMTAYAYEPSRFFEAGDVWFNRFDYNNPALGNFAYYTLGHEVGHALGLEHGHEANGIRNVAMNPDRDSMEFSIMTYRSYVGAPVDFVYNETWGYAQSLMMYDISALQAMYGANFDHNASDTVYEFSPTTGEMSINGVAQGTPGDNRIFRTIWDGDGTDTYNFLNYTTDLNVNLAPGQWSDLDVGGNVQRANLGNGNYARGHVFNALQYEDDPRSLIENAYGGSGNDQLHGNSTSNFLWGNAGNDRLFGYGDNDSLYGSTGNDWVDGGYGLDTMNGGDGIDTLDVRFWGDVYELDMSTGITNFVGETALNFENVYTGAGNDRIVGTSDRNYINTAAGNDSLIGNAGSDVLIGGEGNDLLDGSTVDGTLEIDYLIGGTGADTFKLHTNEMLYQGLSVVFDFNFFQGDTVDLPGAGQSAFTYNFDFQDGLFGGLSGAYLVKLEPNVAGSQVAFFRYNAAGGIGDEAALDAMFNSIAAPVV